MRARVVAAVAAGSLLTAGAVVMLGGATRVVEIAPEVTAQMFVDCARLTSGAEVTEDSVAVDCTQQALEVLGDQGGLPGLDRVLWEAERADPRVIQLCHSLTHGVASAAYSAAEAEETGSGMAALKALFHQDSSGCHGAVMHGALEAWVAASPTKEQFAELARACTELPPGAVEREHRVEVARSGRCADALGHAVWNVWGEPSACAMFTDIAQQNNCSGGVIMQMYRPVGEPIPVEGVGYEDLVEMCRNWPAEVDVDGCNFGVAYAFDHIVSDTLAGMGDELESGGVLTREQWKTLSSSLEDARAWCAKLPDDPDHHCEAGLLVGDALYALDPSVPTKLCAQLTPSRAEQCQGRFALGRG